MCLLPLNINNHKINEDLDSAGGFTDNRTMRRRWMDNGEERPDLILEKRIWIRRGLDK